MASFEHPCALHEALGPGRTAALGPCGCSRRPRRHVEDDALRVDAPRRFTALAPGLSKTPYATSGRARRAMQVERGPGHGVTIVTIAGVRLRAGARTSLNQYTVALRRTTRREQSEALDRPPPQGTTKPDVVCDGPSPESPPRRSGRMRRADKSAVRCPASGDVIANYDQT